MFRMSGFRKSFRDDGICGGEPAAIDPVAIYFFANPSRCANFS